MNGRDAEPPSDRRRRVIDRLVGQYQSMAEPDRWLQEVTLTALRALDRANLAPADKSPARKEIHAIQREVVSKARAMQLTRLARAPRHQGRGPEVDRGDTATAA